MPSRQEILTNDYNPYENRQRPGQTGNLNTLINLVKGILGTGILALPEAFKQSGLIIGAIFSVLITMAITYCLHILYDGMYYVCKRDKLPQLTYPQIMKEALLVGPNCLKVFADHSGAAVNFFIILYQFGVCCVYIVFCASNLKMVVDDNTPNDSHISLMIYMLGLLPLVLLLTYIKNLQQLAPFSNVANWLTLASLIIIYYFVFESIEPFTDRYMVASISTFPLFMGTAMFSVLSIGAILSIELNMKYGQNWGGCFGVLNQAMFIVTILNVVTGFCGYWKYGEDTASSITLNLGKSGLAWAVQVLFALSILISYSLQAYPSIEIIWDQYVSKYMETSKHITFWDYCLRSIMVLTTFLVAVPIPFLGLFISLFGAFCLSMLGIIFPPLIDICLRWNDKDFGHCNLILLRDIALIFLGLAGFSFGTYSALRGICLKFME